MKPCVRIWQSYTNKSPAEHLTRVYISEMTSRLHFSLSERCPSSKEHVAWGRPNLGINYLDGSHCNGQGTSQLNWITLVTVSKWLRPLTAETAAWFLHTFIWLLNHLLCAINSDWKPLPRSSWAKAIIWLLLKFGSGGSKGGMKVVLFRAWMRSRECRTSHL